MQTNKQRKRNKSNNEPMDVQTERGKRMQIDKQTDKQNEREKQRQRDKGIYTAKMK